jgi:lipopolysaccharide assembly protein A
MQFLKTLLWVTLIVGLTVFAINNWVPVSVSLWGGLRLDTKLPALVIAAFVIGFFPLYLFHRTTAWRMKRRILSLEGNQRTATFTPPPVSPLSPPPAYASGEAI